MMIYVEPEINIEEAITAYLEHVRASKEECRKWLSDAFAKPIVEKAEKSKKMAVKKPAAIAGEEAEDDPSLFS